MVMYALKMIKILIVTAVLPDKAKISAYKTDDIRHKIEPIIS